ncbi:MAG: flagellar basal body rod protein FlgB [Desulfobacterales bacterium]|nr:flagellar basal body rod protein FlgB [Desulfobacterales bacterium]
MEAKALFGGTVSVLEKVLDFRSRRHNVIISNVVNADTPGFKAFDIVMDEEVDRLNARASDGLHMAGTNPAHFSTGIQDTGGIRTEYIEHDKLINKGDQNTVDLDRSMSKLAENNLMYNAIAQTITKKFRMLKEVIKGGTT